MNISKTLINWYEKNKRDLPWRKTNSPYNIWISEIILQQTRVKQGVNYYERFIERFPDVNTLAQASEKEVLKLWQGLGYYSRARNLHNTAKTIVNNYNGIFPRSYEKIKALKGIGEYTAAAIASFAFGMPYPAIDGNVMRFFCRMFAIEESIFSATAKKQVKNIATELMPGEMVARFNQAIMEFGALQCLPKNPDCPNCIFCTVCLAYNRKIVDKIPLRNKTTKIRHRYFNYLVLINNEKIIVKNRDLDDIWANLVDFPCIETKNDVVKSNQWNENKQWKKWFENERFELKSISEEYVHQLSHQKLHARFFHIAAGELCFDKIAGEKNHQAVTPQSFKNLPIPRLIDLYVKNALPLFLE